MTKESELKLHPSLIPGLLSGEKEITIRAGERDFEENITIAGYPAAVDAVFRQSLIDTPLVDLFDDGFESFRDALESLQAFYPDLTPESMVTVVRFHLVETA